MSAGGPTCNGFYQALTNKNAHYKGIHYDIAPTGDPCLLRKGCIPNINYEKSPKMPIMGIPMIKFQEKTLSGNKKEKADMLW